MSSYGRGGQSGVGSRGNNAYRELWSACAELMIEARVMVGEEDEEVGEKKEEEVQCVDDV